MGAIKAVQTMTDEELKIVWDALEGSDLKGMYDDITTMLEWALIVYSEMDHRNIPHF